MIATYMVTHSSLLWKFTLTGRVLTPVTGQGLRTMKGQKWFRESGDDKRNGFQREYKFSSC